MTDYVFGNLVRIAVSFEDTAGAPVDPTTLTLYLKRHNAATETVYVYGTDAEIEKDSTGEYHTTLAPSEPGWWFYRWVGEGDAIGATEGSFRMVKDYH